MSSYLDSLPNPLLNALINEADGKGGLTVGDIESFITNAAQVADNLHRLDKAGVPHLTNTVALYSGMIKTDAGSSSVYTGAIAKDLSCVPPT